MDALNEKKWFVYIGDHHEGPFSLADVQSRLAQGQVAVTSYVWAEGMADWIAMNEVPDFAVILSPKAAATQHTGTFNRAPVQSTGPSLVGPAEMEGGLEPMNLEPMPGEAAAPIQITPIAKEKTGTVSKVIEREKTKTGTVSRAVAKDKTGTLDLAKAQQAAAAAPLSSTGGTGAIAKPPKGKSKAVKWVLIAGIPAALIGLYTGGQLDPLLQSPSVQAGAKSITSVIQPYLISLTEKYPALSKWISPIPSIDDVPQLDYEALKAAAIPKLQEGAKLAVALATADPASPSFYVASNLPDGTVLDIYVEGIPDTLLNQLSFNTKVAATIDKKLGKSAAIRMPNNAAIPRGDYMVYVTESPNQPEAAKAALANIPPVTAKVPPALPRGLKLLVSKPYFLGGAKDAQYEARLKDFHNKLNAKATNELMEIKQFASTLASRLEATVANFTKLRAGAKKGKFTPQQHKSWSDFHNGWEQTESAFKESYAKWTPQALATDYFYGVLYDLTQKAGKAITDVHKLQADAVDGKIDPKALDIQLGTTMSGAQSALAALKSKLEQADKLTPTPNGMPRREGL
jgi:hypothetical protein